MRFVLRMAVRELRASWRRLILFFLCIAARRRRHRPAAVGRAGRAGGDRARRPQPDGGRRRRCPRAGRGTRRRARRSSGGWRRPGAGAHRGRRDQHDGAAGGRAPRRSRRWPRCGASQPAFPLYGTVELQDGRPYAHALLEGHGALVRPELLAQLESRVGDDILIGTAPLHGSRRAASSEPGRRRGRLQLRPARPRRRRRPREHRPARVRQPRRRATSS